MEAVEKKATQKTPLDAEQICNDWEIDRNVGYDATTAYLLSLKNFEILEDEEVKELSKRILEKGDLEARNKLIQHNLRLVIKIAKGYYKSWMTLSFLDLIQEGNIGLMHAAEQYDYRFGYRFSTYATWWIKQAVMRGIQNQGRIVRIPVHAHELWHKIKKAQTDFHKYNGRQPTNKELTEALGISEEQVKTALGRMQGAPGYEKSMAQLDAPGFVDKDGGTEGSDLHERTPDISSPTPEQLVEAREELQLACKRLKAVARLVRVVLTERDSLIFKMRYGIDDFSNPKTLEEVGKAVSLTRERVRQIQVRIWKKLNALGVKQNDAMFSQELERIQVLEKLTGEKAR